MKRGLLALAAFLLLANLTIVVVRTQKEMPAPVATDPLTAFEAAMKRHDYAAAYRLTDLGVTTVVGGSSAISLQFFAAFARAHPLRDLTESGGAVHVPTTNVTISAPTGPLPSLSIDGVGVPLRPSRVKATVAAAFTYRYAVVVISGPHVLGVGPGPVTAGRMLSVAFSRSTAAFGVPLVASSAGYQRMVTALDAITRGCPDNLCLVAPCGGRGGEYVLDAWGIGTPPIVARALVGDRIVGPMPPNGWSIAVTFADQGQPPGLSGHEQTVQVRARYVFGFVGSSRGTLLDRCWVSHQ